MTAKTLANTVVVTQLRGQLFDVHNITQRLGVTDWDRIYHAGQWNILARSRFGPPWQWFLRWCVSMLCRGRQHVGRRSIKQYRQGLD